MIQGNEQTSWRLRATVIVKHSVARSKQVTLTQGFSAVRWWCMPLIPGSKPTEKPCLEKQKQNKQKKTGFLCVTVLTVLELALVDQAGLELTDISLPLPPKC